MECVGIPVLITSVSRRCFVDAWKIAEETNLGNYAAGMRRVAEGLKELG